MKNQINLKEYLEEQKLKKEISWLKRYLPFLYKLDVIKILEKIDRPTKRNGGKS